MSRVLNNEEVILRTEDEKNTMFSAIVENSEWKFVDCKNLKCFPFENVPILSPQQRRQFNISEQTEEDVLNEARESTSLGLKYEDGENSFSLPFTQSAIDVLASSAGLGKAFTRTTACKTWESPKTPIERANDFNDNAPHSGIRNVIFAIDGAIRAVHNKDTYSILPVDELDRILRNGLNNLFGEENVEYLTGSASYALYSSVYAVKNNAVIDNIKNIFVRHGIALDDCIPCVRFTTSDISLETAKIIPYIYQKSKMEYIPLSEPLFVKHVNDKTVADFEALIPGLMSSYRDIEQKILELERGRVDKIYDSCRNICKRCKIPSKLADDTAHNLESMYNTNSIRQIDIFMAISESIAFHCNCNNKPATTRIIMEDSLATCMNCNFKECFDKTFVSEE